MFEAELEELEAIDPAKELPSDEGRASIHARMRAQAIQSPERLAEWVRTVDPREKKGSNQLADVYEALAPDAASLQGFFLAELNRVLSVCEASPRSKEAFATLGWLCFLEPDAPDGMRVAMRSRLMEGLRSPFPSIRRACVDLIGGHEIGRDAAARSAVAACLEDGDWRVRALAESTLSEDGLLPPNYSVSLADRVRRKIFSWTDYV
jgi:hypothetical protein